MKPQLALDNSPLSTLVGMSPGMKNVHQQVQRMARCRFPVLILGETGTGKEVVARAIHNSGKGGPFVVVDCSSLVGPLMESELFGYSRGAFTGANNQKLGLLDAANGGTAFFDEIGELPLDLQMKLLRVLQEKEFRAVGGLTQRSSDFRIIAATNRDLTEEIEKKRFRQDLYYRLAVMRLRLPPLRERPTDIPVLISHFLEKHGRGHRVPEDVMDVLVQYEWPGNVRQLEHSVQQMVAMNSGPWIGMGDLPSAILNRLSEGRADHLATPLSPFTTDSAHPGVSPISPIEGGFTEFGRGILPLAEVERRAILSTIEYTKGDRTVAAAMLGIGRTTLYRKLKQYGL
ncbi:MAG TPA: sigma-54 dependent transcriptional regulator [Bryobacteraceae bacterium]|jgi:DNA-binding NtrC family response regulator|nr:sigma-54 dependent transcriptional regulator [Bryobacteraceae bacterium]